MSRLLISSYSIMGHYRPFVPLIQQLMEDGHEIMYVSDRPVPAVAELGCQTRTLGVPTRPVPTGEEKARVVDDPEAIRKFQHWVRIEIPTSHIDPFRAIVADFAPDLMVVDAAMYAGSIAAHLEKVRWLSLFTTLNPYLYWLDTPLKREAAEVAPAIVAMFASFGLSPEFRIWEVISPLLNISFVTRELIGRDTDVPKNTLLAGFSIPPVLKGEGDDFPWERLKTDRPIVFLSFGSLNFWQPRMTRILAEAAAPLGVQLVIACGDMANTEHVKDLPGETLVVRLAPQPRLLEKSAVFITHAGPASLNEACYFGVPMLAIPITSDQPLTGHLIAHMAHVGITISPPDVEVSNCREALVALLADNSEFRTNVNAVKASFRRQNARKVAADAIARIAAGTR